MNIYKKFVTAISYIFYFIFFFCGALILFGLMLKALDHYFLINSFRWTLWAISHKPLMQIAALFMCLVVLAPRAWDKAMEWGRKSNGLS